MSVASTGPLAGIRVLDITRIVAGPVATQMLGDLGADVVKIERLGEGDDNRRVGPPWMKDEEGQDTEESTYFQAVNRNKRSVAVDYSTPEGRALLRALALKADVLIENYRPGTLAKYGLDYVTLSELNPRLVYCSLTGFGQTGPYSGRSGYDYLVQAMSGMMTVNGPADGTPGGGPTRVGIPIADICAGMYCTIGVLAALNHRAVSGRGQDIDISLFESQLGILLNAFSSYYNSGTALARTGNDHPSTMPYGVYAVDDGNILIATFSDREFVRLAAALGHPEWSLDERFAKNGARVRNREDLRKRITDALRGKTKVQWVNELNAATVSCGPINTIPDLKDDPQVQARGIMVEMEHSKTGKVVTVANPIRFSETPVTYRYAPPSLGEHDAEVLKDWLALDESEITKLYAAKAI